MHKNITNTVHKEQHRKKKKYCYTMAALSLFLVGIFFCLMETDHTPSAEPVKC